MNAFKSDWSTDRVELSKCDQQVRGALGSLMWLANRPKRKMREDRFGIIHALEWEMNYQCNQMRSGELVTIA